MGTLRHLSGRTKTTEDVSLTDFGDFRRLSFGKGPQI